MDVKKTAAQILKEVGGKENIKEMFQMCIRDSMGNGGNRTHRSQYCINPNGRFPVTGHQ